MAVRSRLQKVVKLAECTIDLLYIDMDKPTIMKKICYCTHLSASRYKIHPLLYASHTTYNFLTTIHSITPDNLGAWQRVG